MAEAVPAMGRQVVIGRIGRRRAVEIHRDDGGIGPSKADIACAELAHAMKQRRQQAKHESKDERQAALPSAALSCTVLNTARHGLPVEFLSGLFKAG